MNQRCKDCEYVMFIKGYEMETGKKVTHYFCGHASKRKEDEFHLLPFITRPSRFRKCDLYMKKWGENLVEKHNNE